MNAFPVLLCPLIGFAIVVVVIVFIVRAIARSGSGTAGGIQPSLPNVVTQSGDDGFWIVSCPVEPASMIHYHYWSGGVKHSGQVPFQPGTDGRQFVYTGPRPEQVTIVRIIEPADDIQPDIAPPIFGAAAAIFGSSSYDQPDTPSAPPPPPQFPTAY